MAYTKRLKKNGVNNYRKKDNSKYVAARGSIPIYQIHNDVCPNKKRKSDDHHIDSNKKQKNQHIVEETHKFISFEYEFDRAQTSSSTGNVICSALRIDMGWYKL